MQVECKEVPAKDKFAVFALIELVTRLLPDSSWFIPYEEWELSQMFDHSYA